MKLFKQNIGSILKNICYFGQVCFLEGFFLKMIIPTRLGVWLVKKPLFWGVLWLGFLGLSCGLVGHDFSANRGGNNLSVQNSSRDRGTFNNPNGRLTSRSTCLDNDDCIEMCDSMLERLYFQQDCYDYTETQVQALRDTYNLLALGRSDKLSQIEPDEMETFLKFGPVLYESAIYGFTRGLKEGCKPNTGADYAPDREDCRLENYYQQEGYRSRSAANALEWIAENNWLAKLILENDKDHIIMLALLKVLSDGGNHPIEDNEPKNEPDGDKDSVCDGKSKDSNAEDTLFKKNPGKNICGTTNESCEPKNSYRDHYDIFFKQCLDGNKSYLTIANDNDKDDDEVSDSEELACNLLKEKLCSG